MPFAQIDGIKTSYQVTGNGTPLLMPKATLSPLMPPQPSPAAVGQWIRESARAMTESAVAA